MDREGSLRCWELALEMHRSMSEKEMTEVIGDDLHARVQKLFDGLDEVSDTEDIQEHRLDQMTGDLEDETDGPIEKLLRGLSSLEDKEEAKRAGIDLTDQTILDAKRLLSLNIADPEIKQMQASALQAIHALGDQSEATLPTASPNYLAAELCSLACIDVTSRWHPEYNGVTWTQDRLGDNLAMRFWLLINKLGIDEAGSEGTLEEAAAFIRSLLRYESLTCALIKLAFTGYAVELIEQFQCWLDSLSSTQSNDYFEIDWRRELFQERTDRIWYYEELLNDDNSLHAEIMREIKDSKSDEHDYYVEVLTLLKYGYTTHSSLLMQREQDAIQEVFLQVCQMSGINLISLPIWFTSPMEIEHTNQSTKWRGAEVSVYSPPRGSETEESCLTHVLQLRNLNYPHVAKLIAASHVGARVYLYEFAKSDDAIFSRDGKFSWIAVYECILGLRYLNIRGAAHRSFSQRCIMKTRSEKVVLTGNDLVVVPEIEANELLADSFHILTQLVRSSLCYHGLAESPEETTVLESMADFDCNNPIQIPRLLQQFQTHLFATRSAVTKQSIGDLDRCLCDAFATSDGRTFSSAFSDLEDYFCIHETNSLDLLVYHKLLEIYKLLCNRTCSSLPIDLLMKFKEVITRFYNATVAKTSSSCSVLSELSVDETAMGFSFSFGDCIEQLALFPELAEIFVVDGNFLKASTVVSNRATVGQICSDQEEIAIVALYESTRRSKLQLSGWRLPQQAQLPAKSELILEELPEWFIPPNEIERGEYVAEGSFGAVYRGKWFGTDVAVKTLVSTATLEDRQAFKHEADIWFLLSQHPNVVQFYGANHVGSQPFFVCEWAGNGTLPEFIGKGWNRSFVWSHLHTVAIALKFLHDRGITHGDLKGNNILIGSDGCVKLADFGLSVFARVDNRGFEKGKERCLGAYRWKAPEVLRGEPSTFASDVFSFAMCIIEVVSGQVPWGPTIPDSSVKFKVMRGCLPRRPDGLFNEEWKMIRLMCACDPAHRVDMASVVKALRDFSDGELDVGSSSASIEL